MLAVIVARAGSKGLPNKCVAPLAGRAVIEYTFDAAQAARRVDAVCLTTDAPAAQQLARARHIAVVERPPDLATDTATVDAAVRHAVEQFETRPDGFRPDIVVLLYGNVPLRPDGAIDRAIDHLLAARADSVRTVAPVTKQHPDWIHRLSADRMVKFRENSIYRRQELEPLFYHDGAVVVLTRAALFTTPAHAADFHAFFGRERSAIVVEAGATVDIDDPRDLALAEALLSAQLAGPPSFPLIVPGQPYVIAEAGVNHDGALDQARRLIDAARAAGADAVKFQAFSADELVSRSAAACDYQRRRDPAATPQHAMLRRLELPADALAALRNHARGAGIEFLCTPFGVRQVRELAALGVRAL
ncbi:MAG: N-acetylneuraminate synthase family protein, partial [Candidatus Binatia bacterium]